ncbi:MAG TPA: hypothetical protein VD833_19495 [Vicinamibacterales bacterium]|nr:hypothetical protein [Vicinamibacterales bacterium]
MHRRGILKSMAAALAAAAGAAGLGSAGRAQTRHIRLYVEMDIDAAQEREMLDLFHKQFVPEAVRHEGYMRVKLLKRRTILQGTAPAAHNYRFELEFESEELRQRWIASPGHQRVWPPIERFIRTKGSYPVVLYDEM